MPSPSSVCIKLEYPHSKNSKMKIMTKYSQRLQKTKSSGQKLCERL